jgi:4'-phosphopantetheinyl transferase
LATVSLPTWPPGPQQPELPQGVVDVWRADLSAIREPLERLLSEQELERAQRLLSASHRRLWVRSRGLLRELLGRYLAEDPSALRFAVDAHGKPYLTGAAQARVQFNLSHSGTLALYAFRADAPVGVDVQADRRPSDDVGIAARILGPAAAAQLRAIGDPRERHSAFLQMWTRYEAETKCVGTGIGADTPSSRAGVWSAALDMGIGAAGAVACANEPLELRRWEWRAG